MKVASPAGIMALGLYAVGLALFAGGFFPLKRMLPGFSQPEPSTDPAVPVYDRLVLMVVDALRHDFVHQRPDMEFTRREIAEGRAQAFVALAAAPTVTMPRIKALTTGSTPNFLDILLNFDASSSTLQHQDNWLHQLRHHRNFSIDFYGDDTWLKLFPGMFRNAEGVNSFYVADTVEVDQNVTRNVQRALMQEGSQDWDVLVLHYLGVDHIGHIGGPQSPMLPPKLREMDGVVETILTAVAKHPERRTLMVLCGDHGMNEVGNHGGSSYGEVATAMVFFTGTQSTVSIPREPPEISQIDLVPTLSALLGIPIPKNSLGKLVPSLVPRPQRDTYLARNAKQLMAILETTRGPLPPGNRCADKLSCLVKLFWDAMLATTTEQRSGLYQKFILETSNYLTSSFGEYKLSWMYLGIGCMTVGLTMFLHPIVTSPEFTFTQPMVIALTLFWLSMFSSSFVEEEQDFWFYVVPSVWTWLTMRSHVLPRHAISGMGFHRLMYAWNQTGIKWSHLKEDVRTNMTEIWLWNAVPVVQLALFVGSMLAVVTLQWRQSRRRLDALLVAIAAVLVTICKYKLAPGLDEKLLARCIYSVLLGNCLLSRRTILASVILLCTLLSRIHNAPLILLACGATWLMLRHVHHPPTTILLFTALVQFSFFAFGNSNSIATIDMSHSYMGLDETSPMAFSGLLTFLTTFAGPICVATTLATVTPSPRYWLAVNGFLLFRLVSLWNISIAVTFFRHHLFIWSVFSPKFLYEAGWLFGYGGFLLGFGWLIVR